MSPAASFPCIYLHGGAVALVTVSEPAVACCTLVQVDVLNVDVHTDHSSNTEHIHIKRGVGSKVKV